MEQFYFEKAFNIYKERRLTGVKFAKVELVANKFTRRKKGLEVFHAVSDMYEIASEILKMAIDNNIFKFGFYYVHSVGKNYGYTSIIDNYSNKKELNMWNLTHYVNNMISGYNKLIDLLKEYGVLTQAGKINNDILTVYKAQAEQEQGKAPEVPTFAEQQAKYPEIYNRPAEEVAKDCERVTASARDGKNSAEQEQAPEVPGAPTAPEKNINVEQEPTAPGAKKKPAKKKDVLKVFTFSIAGLSYYYNTVEDMRHAVEQFQAQGRTIDPHSIDIIEVEKPKRFKALAKRVIADLNAGDMYSDYMKGENHITLYYINGLTLHLVDWYAQNKLALTQKEFKTMTHFFFGVYDNYSEPELRRALAWDYIDIMLLSDESTPKSFTEFKKNIISQC